MRHSEAHIFNAIRFTSFSVSVEQLALVMRAVLVMGARGAGGRMATRARMLPILTGADQADG
jgi:hypothetical protein